ncbi:MAG: MBL fold metallo-hydrolase [Verrucomicrobia bacterium]|nr:MBL fold metallo-hydrolase [Verrucomicrobiota bacterium]MDA1068667.1 MBL fold metallo-hydrolase [Verrucomicrobiota bacterium]
MKLRKFLNCLTVSLFAGIVFQFPAANAKSHADEHGLDPREDSTVQYVEPFRIFDNLSFVGMEWVSAYVLETSDGLILIDSLYGEHVEHLLNGMRKLGFDPADIKAVLCTHGHFDHMGGAAELQRWTGCQVGMTPKDWLMVERGETFQVDR